MVVGLDSGGGGRTESLGTKLTRYHPVGEPVEGIWDWEVRIRRILGMVGFDTGFGFWFWVVGVEGDALV